MTDYGDYVGQPPNRELEILRMELEEARALLARSTDVIERFTEMTKTQQMEILAAKAVATKHLAALEEAQSENRTLREAVRQLTADVSHYMQHGPAVPAHPAPMVKNADG